MSERYKKLYRLEHRLYASGAPVIIAAGALLRDEYSGSLLCQLKFRNIQSRTIKALRVLVEMRDVDGEPLDKPVPHRYLDLNLQQEEEFGRDVAIVLPSREVRAFRVSVNQVSFADGEIWKNEKAVWKPLKDQPSLAEYYGDKDLALQFQIRYGSDCLYPCVVDRELWFCTCGAVNPLSEGKCHVCRRSRRALTEVSEASLRAEAQSRQESEQLQSAQEVSETAQRRKKGWKLAAVILPLLILLIGSLIAFPRMLSRSHAYDDARALLEAGQYEQAEAAFAALGDYRDSADYAEKQIPYRLAEELMRAAEEADASALAKIGRTEADLKEENSVASLLYQAAAERFGDLGDYADSAEKQRQCLDALEALDYARLQRRYDDATALLDAGAYAEARQLFLQLGDFSDSADMAREAVYQKALGLYRFAEQHKVRGISASLSAEAGESVISLTPQSAEALGAEGMEALRAAFGEDPLVLRTEDAPSEELLSLPEALSALFASLGDYRDSPDLAASILEITDYSREFYQLCESGQIPEALAWLTAYEGDWENREQWLERLALYVPYCSEWTLHSGDPTLIPRITGREGSCYDMKSLVILREEKVTLRLILPGEAEYFLELNTEPGQEDFFYSADGFRYFAFRTKTGRLALVKWDIASICGSVEYEAK